MRTMLKAGLSVAALAAAAAFAPANAADLYGPRGGSIKDRGPVAYEPAPVYSSGGARPCYVRGDLGYSWGRAPTIKWPVSNGGWNYVGEGTYDATTGNVTPPAAGFSAGFDPNAASSWSQTSTFAGEDVTNSSMANALVGGLGFGCNLGVMGLRGEFMLGATGKRKIDGEPGIYSPAGPQPIANPLTPPVAPTPYDDPLHTHLKSYTAMVNVYRDLGTYGGVTPYIGAGVGVAYNTLSEVYFTGNPALTNRIEGNSRASLAWSLMAGIGWQMTERATLDLGYKYMDYGKAISGRVDNAGFVNPAVRINDITAHEFRVGLRYSFGSSCCEATPVHGPLK